MPILSRPVAFAATVACALFVSACGPHTAAPTADSRLRELYTHEWQWRQAQFAESADERHSIVDHLPNVDAAAQQIRLDYWQDVLATLQSIPRPELSPAEQRKRRDALTPLRQLRQHKELRPSV